MLEGRIFNTDEKSKIWYIKANISNLYCEAIKEINH